MPLDLPDGDRCFIDANIFCYHFVETPPFSEPCTTFLERAASGTIEAFTLLHVLSEVVHKVMVAEAGLKLGHPRAGLVNWLQHNRHRISELSQFRQAADELAAMGLQVLPAGPSDLVDASVLSGRLGLLTNDALIVTLLRRESLSNLITNDDDFDGIAGLTVWKPRGAWRLHPVSIHRIHPIPPPQPPLTQ